MHAIVRLNGLFGEIISRHRTLKKALAEYRKYDDQHRIIKLEEDNERG
jgi:hypothetical protein